jgi:hypothetical protein
VHFQLRLFFCYLAPVSEIAKLDPIDMSHHEAPLSQQSSKLDDSSSQVVDDNTCEFDDTFMEVPIACVKFVENYVTEIRYRPRTLAEEKPVLFYQESDFQKFRAEYTALKREYNRRHQRNVGSEQQNVSRPAKTMLSRFLLYVFNSDESPVSTRISTHVEPSSLKAAELLYSWDLGLISASF